VAVTAVNAVGAHVALVTEGDRLFPVYVHLREEGRPVQCGGEKRDDNRPQDTANNTGSGKHIGAAMKNLSHENIPFLPWA
jgi:hypothetical protein